MGPFITVPIDGGGMGMSGPPGGRMLGRGGMGMRGRGARGGYGGYGGPPAAKLGREYYDLDAPENQRSVLDYGDL